MTAYTGEVVIRPTRGLHLIRVSEIWAYRDLLWLFIWRDFVARYRQTLLGPLWYVLQPLATTLIFTLVFNRVAGLPTNGVPPSLFYLCGLLPWSYFSQTFSSISGTLVANAALLGKIYFPRLVMPLAVVISNSLVFLIQLGVFLAVYGLHKALHPDIVLSIGWRAALVPLVWLQVAILSLGAGLWVAALTTKFRDFAVLSSFTIQLWMYVTPVIFPLAQVPEKWRIWMALNPMAVPVEAFRGALLGVATLNGTFVAISLVVTVAAIVSGLLLFQQIERTFVDVI